MAGLALLLATAAAAQQATPEMLREASRRTGLSEEEILRRLDGADAGVAPVGEAPAGMQEPGRTDLEGIDDRLPGRGEASYWTERPDVLLPMSEPDSMDVAAIL